MIYLSKVREQQILFILPFIFDFTAFLFLFSSNDKKLKYHQAYFLISAIGFMNCGGLIFLIYHFCRQVSCQYCWCYIYSLSFPLYQWTDYHDRNIDSFCTPLVSQVICLDQLPYLLILPSAFLVANKRNREIDIRKDFYQWKKLTQIDI